MNQGKIEISKVELATGDCFCTCQYTATSIDSSLNFTFYGGPRSPGKTRKTVKSYYTGRIGRSFWVSLNSKLEHIRYKQLDTSYQQSAGDQSLELIVYYQNKVKHIKAQSASLSDSVSGVFYWIADAYKKINLIPDKRPIAYHTKVQKEFKMPLSLDSIDFPPPK